MVSPRLPSLPADRDSGRFTLITLGDEVACFFCGCEACRPCSSIPFSVEFWTCDACGESADGLFRILEHNGPASESTHDGDSEARASECDAKSVEFEDLALRALEDVLSIHRGDPILTRAVQSITASAAANVFAQLIRLGKV